MAEPSVATRVRMIPLCSTSFDNKVGIALARQMGEEAAVACGLDDEVTATRVATAVSELVANGVRYAGSCVLTCWLSEDPWTLHIEVEDDGPGIEELTDDASTTTASAAGRGLAGTLALVDELVIDTESGKGTTASISMALPGAPSLDVAVIRDRIRGADPDEPVVALREQNRMLLRALGELQQEREQRMRQQRLLELLMRRADVAAWELQDGERVAVADAITPSALWEAAFAVPESVHPDDAAVVAEAYERLIGEGQEVRIEYRLRVDADYRWVGEQATRVHVRGKRARVIGSTVDIDDAVRSREEAERLASLRERMVSIVGHDLRGPLGAVHLGLGTLKLVAKDPQVVDLIEPMERSLDRATGMLRDLLDYVRGRGARGLPVSKAPVELPAVVREQVDEARMAWPDVRFVVDDVAEGGGGDPLQADADRLAQAVSNLLRNAAVHGDGEVHVAVNARRVEVHNGGYPIPDDARATLFEPFHGKGGEGLGLGLWIARLIVRAHQGQLTFTSDEADGTRFVIDL